MAQGNRWTVPVEPEEIQAARQGHWEVLLTPMLPVPRDWFPPLAGARVLGLACGGGQQCPLFAAAGARVAVLDASSAQLDRDRQVAREEGLNLEAVQGDMAHLDAFESGSFDLIFHPVSNCFAPEVIPVWKEAFRVLRPGGVLLAGFANPALYLFDEHQVELTGELLVCRKIPHADTELPRRSRERLEGKKEGNSERDQNGEFQNIEAWDLVFH